MKSSTVALIVVAVVIVALLAAWVWRRNRKPKHHHHPHPRCPVKVNVVQAGDDATIGTLTVMGNVQNAKTITITALTGGNTGPIAAALIGTPLAVQTVTPGNEGEYILSVNVPADASLPATALAVTGCAIVQ